jgi:hypothetical protein
MLGQAAALCRRPGIWRASLARPQNLAAAQRACTDQWIDLAAAQCSVRLASGGSGALTPYQGRSSLTAAARSLLVDTLDMEKLSEAYVTKAQLEKTVLEQISRDAGFKSEVLKAQDMHHTTLNRESERLANDVAKVRSEIRYEVEKLTASQRLDLNLEKGRMRDELQALRDKSNELEIKIDKEINALKAAVELTKNETIKYSLGMMFALLTVGLGVVRLIR